MARTRWFTLAGLGLTAAAALAVMVVLANGAAAPGTTGDGAGPAEVAAMDAPPAPAPEVSAAPEPGYSPSGGPGEGVKVHGHWTIEVLDPDGTRASITEFDNAFYGASILSSFLRRQASVGLWEVWLGVEVGTMPCSANNTSVFCLIVEAASDRQGSPNVYNNLQVTGGNGGQVVLSGSATVANSTTITVVRTTVRGCPASVAPSLPCLYSALDSFTAVGGQNVAVTAGQLVLATVTISFQ